MERVTGKFVGVPGKARARLTWCRLEGILLCTLYVIIALAAWFYPESALSSPFPGLFLF